MSFFIFGWLLQKQNTFWVAVAAIAFCFFVETSQLFQVDWLNAVRASRIGALILGNGFLLSDLLAYCMGVAFGALVERKILPQKFKYRH